MNSDLTKRILEEIDKAQSDHRAVNPECVSDRDLFNSYVSQLKEDGCIEALIQPDMTGRGSIHAVVVKGLTPAGRDLLATLKVNEKAM